jgi:hypothetical protein
MHTGSSVAPPPARAVVRDNARRGVLLLVALLTVVVLVLTGSQIYDSNLIALSEATALLAGDQPAGRVPSCHVVGVFATAHIPATRGSSLDSRMVGALINSTSRNRWRCCGYLLKNYSEVEGSQGKILVDTRRRPTGQFGPEGFPCFR